MSRMLTEWEVLNILEIDDFRHLTKDKVLKMASLLNQMDPEVAKKALEQFPEFSGTIRELLQEYKDMLDQSLASNRESVQAYYATCNTIMESLKQQLESPELSFEERKYIIDRMLELSRQMGEKDTENKRFLKIMAVVATVAVGIAASALASVLGGNIETNLDITDIEHRL